jgi:hypothetical protein
MLRALVFGLALLTLVVAPGGSAKGPAGHDKISYHGWTTGADFASGAFDGAHAVAVGDGAITFGTAAGTFA